MINLVITDVDGILNTGKFVYTKNGKYSKEFGPHDSDGIKLLIKNGISVIGISADKRGFKITKKRFEDMNVELYLVTESDRFQFLQQYDKSTTVFIGDGLYDCKGLNYFDLTYSTLNACNLAKKAAKQIINLNGGEGILLEVAIDILKKYKRDFYNQLMNNLGFRGN